MAINIYHHAGLVRDADGLSPDELQDAINGDLDEHPERVVCWVVISAIAAILIVAWAVLS